jgi:hypothetical protein
LTSSKGFVTQQGNPAANPAFGGLGFVSRRADAEQSSKARSIITVGDEPAGRRNNCHARHTIASQTAALIEYAQANRLSARLRGSGLGLLLAYTGDRLVTIGMARYGLSLPNARVIDTDWRCWCSAWRSRWQRELCSA